MTAANGDRITVQRVTQTVAGEHLEWAITVRRSSPAGVGDPLNAQTDGAHELLPDDVRELLARWLDTPPRWSRGGWTGPRRPDGAPLLVGRDFVVGDRVRGEERAPRRVAPVPDPRTVGGSMFPIGKTVPGAPYAGRTAPRRTLPPEAPVRLWNAEHTDHLDVIGWAHRTRSFDDGSGRIRTDTLDSVRIRLADKHAAVARAWITVHALQPDGTVFVAWLDREWTLAGYSFGDGPATIDVLPIPKPPRVDQVLGRETHEDRKQLRRDFAASRPGHVTACTECGGAPGEVHPAWCSHSAVIRKPGAKTVSPYTDLGQVLTKGERFAVEWPDGTTRTYTYSGDPADPVADEPDPAKLGAKLNAMRGALSAALDLDKAPEAYNLPDGVGLGTVPEYGQPVDTSCPEHGVDCVLPMPGGPNDRLSQAARPTIPRHPAQAAPDALHFQTGKPFTGYADLYARLDAIHDATAEEDQ